MTTLTATLLADSRCKLGEGVQWNARTARVYWTDIFGDALWSCDEEGQDLERMALPAGLCAFAFTDDKMLAAFVDGLYWFDPETGGRVLIKLYQPDNPDSRMNDGGLDRQGRFVVGGIDEEGMRPTTPVWRFDANGVEEIIDGVGCANSIVFSPDGRRMYFCDTASTQIYVYDYDTATGQVANRTLFADSQKGKPDGSCIDAEGALWNARFEGGGVIRFLDDGREDSFVALPVPNVTCCCIGGRDMDRLFITSARLGMTETELAEKPEAGGLFYCDLPVKGLDHGRFLTT